jgi:hypothetical protein
MLSRKLKRSVKGKVKKELLPRFMSARKLLMKVKASHSQTSFHDSDSTRARPTAAVDVFTWLM